MANPGSAGRRGLRGPIPAHPFLLPPFPLPPQVAIKKVPAWTSDATDGKRVLREVRLLRFLRHENVTPLVDLEMPPSRAPEGLSDVYIITSLFEADLHRITYSKQVSRGCRERERERETER